MLALGPLVSALLLLRRRLVKSNLTICVDEEWFLSAEVARDLAAAIADLDELKRRILRPPGRLLVVRLVLRAALRRC